MKHLLFGALLICLAVGLPALDVQDGRIRLTLDENSSRFLVALVGPGDNVLPLLFPEDPRTSATDVRAGNRVFRMGDSGGFRQVAEQTEEGVFYVWTSNTLRVSQRFRFVRSVGGDAPDGIQLDIAITNLGEQTIPVAIRLLLDTYLGERSNAHFSTPIRQEITREATIVPSDRQSYLRSMQAETPNGLQVMLFGGGITVPQSVAVANWKRLSDSNWDYAVNEDRNFNRLPYSINDSAVLLTYPEVVLAQNERHTVTVRLGAPAQQGYLDPDASLITGADVRVELLDQLTGILARIDALLSDPTATPEDIVALREQLESLSEQVRGQ